MKLIHGAIQRNLLIPLVLIPKYKIVVYFNEKLKYKLNVTLRSTICFGLIE